MIASEAVRVRRALIVFGVVASLAVGGWLGLAAVLPASSGPCQFAYGSNVYCTKTSTVSGMCEWGAPCPATPLTASFPGYQFYLRGYSFSNGTTELAGTVLDPNGSYGVFLQTPLFPGSLGWAAGGALVFWPSGAWSHDGNGAWTTVVVCGIEASLAQNVSGDS